MFSFSSKPASGAGGRDAQLADKVKEWKSGLRKEVFAIDRSIREVQREEEKMKREIKQYAKKDPVIVKMLAKNIVKSRKAVERLTSTKAQLNSVSMQLQEQYGMARMSGTMAKSAGIMQAMGALISAPEVMAVMRTMGEEMAKAGIVDEMVSDAMASTEPEGLDEEADEEVEKVMTELTAGVLGAAPDAPLRGLPGRREAAPAAAAPAAAAAGPARVAVAAGADGSDAGGGDLGDLASRLGRI